MKRIFVTGDLHSGSIFGLLPPGYERADKQGKGYLGRSFLWKQFQKCCKDSAGCDVVIVNGDVIDGKQEAQRQTEMNLAGIDEQINAAEEVLRQLKPAKNAKWYFTQGSEYHDQKGCPAVEELASRFNAVKPTPADNFGGGARSWEVLDLDVEGVILNVQHTISVSSGFYRTTAYDREGVWSALAGKAGKVPKADCVIRSHAHMFVHVEHESKHIVGVPCWELQTRFMRKNSAYRMIPDIGAVILHIDGRRKARGYDPVVVEKLLYPLPPKKLVKL